MNRARRNGSATVPTHTDAVSRPSATALEFSDDDGDVCVVGGGNNGGDGAHIHHQQQHQQHAFATAAGASSAMASHHRSFSPASTAGAGGGRSAASGGVAANAKMTLLALAAALIPKALHRPLGIPRLPPRQQRSIISPRAAHDIKMCVLVIVSVIVFVLLVRRTGWNFGRRSGGADKQEEEERLRAEEEAAARHKEALRRQQEDTHADIDAVEKMIKIAQRLERQSEGLGLFQSTAFAFSEFRLARIAERAEALEKRKREAKSMEDITAPAAIEQQQQKRVATWDGADGDEEDDDDGEHALRDLLSFIDYQQSLYTAEGPNHLSGSSNSAAGNIDAATLLSLGGVGGGDPVFSGATFEHNNPLAASREGNFVVSDFTDFTTEELLAATVLFRAEALATLASAMESARLRALRRRGLHADNRNLLKGRAAEANEKRLAHLKEGKDADDDGDGYDDDGDDNDKKSNKKKKKDSLDDDDGYNDDDGSSLKKSLKKKKKKKGGVGEDDDANSPLVPLQKRDGRRRGHHRHRGSSDVVPLRACFLTLANHEDRPARDRFGNVKGFGSGGTHDNFLSGGGLTNLHRLLVNVRQTLPLMASRYPFIIFHEDTSVVSSEAIGRGLLEKEMSFNARGFQHLIDTNSHDPNRAAAPGSDMYTYGGAVDFEPMPDEMAKKRLRRRRQYGGGGANNNNYNKGAGNNNGRPIPYDPIGAAATPPPPIRRDASKNNNANAANTRRSVLQHDFENEDDNVDVGNEFDDLNDEAQRQNNNNNNNNNNDGDVGNDERRDDNNDAANDENDINPIVRPNLNQPPMKTRAAHPVLENLNHRGKNRKKEWEEEQQQRQRDEANEREEVGGFGNNNNNNKGGERRGEDGDNWGGILPKKKKTSKKTAAPVNINVIPDEEENKRLGRVEGDHRNAVEKLADDLMPIAKENHPVDDWELLKNQVLRAARDRLDRIRAGEGVGGGGGEGADGDDHKYENHNAINDMLNLNKKERNDRNVVNFGGDNDDNNNEENVPISDALEITQKMIDRVEREGARGELLAALNRFVFPRTLSNPYSEGNAVSLRINAGSYASFMESEEGSGNQQHQRGRGGGGAPPPLRLKPITDHGALSAGARRPYDIVSVYSKRVVTEHDIPTDGSMYILAGDSIKFKNENEVENEEEPGANNNNNENNKALILEKQRLAHEAILAIEGQHGQGAIIGGDFEARLRALEDASNVRNVAARKPRWKLAEEARLKAQKERREEAKDAEQRREMDKMLRQQRAKDQKHVAGNREDERDRDDEIVGDRGAEVEHRIRSGLFFEPIPPADFGQIPPWIDTNREWPVPLQGISGAGGGGVGGGGRGSHQQKLIRDGLVARNRAEAERIAALAQRGVGYGGGGARQQESSANERLGFRHMSRFFSIRIFNTKFFSAKDVPSGGAQQQLSSRQFDYFFRLDTDAFILSAPLYTHLDAVLERKRYRWDKKQLLLPTSAGDDGNANVNYNNNNGDGPTAPPPVYEMKSRLQRTGHFKLQERDLFLAMAERRLQMGFSSIDTAKDSLYTTGLHAAYDEFIAEEEGKNADDHFGGLPKAQREEFEAEKGRLWGASALVGGGGMGIGGVHPLSDISSTVAPRRVFAHFTSFAEIVNLNMIRPVSLHIPPETERTLEAMVDDDVIGLFSTRTWGQIREAAGLSDTEPVKVVTIPNADADGDGQKTSNAEEEDKKGETAKQRHAGGDYYRSNIDELRLAYANIDEEMRRAGARMDADVAAELAAIRPTEKHPSAEAIAAYNSQAKQLLLLRATALQKKAEQRRRAQIALQGELEKQRRANVHMREQELTMGLRVPRPEEARLMLCRGLFAATIGAAQLPEFAPAAASPLITTTTTATPQEDAAEEEGEERKGDKKKNKEEGDASLSAGAIINEETELESYLSVSGAVAAFHFQRDLPNRRVTAAALRRFLDDKIRFIYLNKHYARARAVARARALRQLLLLDAGSPLLGLALFDYTVLMRRHATAHNLRTSMGGRFLEHVEKRGGIYYNRWSDSLVRTAHFSLIAEPNEVAQIDTLSLQHRESYHCHKAKSTLAERNSYGGLVAGLGSREGLVYDAEEHQQRQHNNALGKDSSEGPLSAAKNRALHAALDALTQSPAVTSILSAEEAVKQQRRLNGGNNAFNSNKKNKALVPLAVLSRFVGSGRWFRQQYSFSFAKTEAGAARGGGAEPTMPLAKLLRLLEETLLPEAPEDWGFADYGYRDNSLSHVDLPLIGATLQSYRRPNIKQRAHQREREEEAMFAWGEELLKEGTADGGNNGRQGEGGVEEDGGKKRLLAPFWIPQTEEDLFEAVTVSRGIELFASFSAEGLIRRHRRALWRMRRLHQAEAEAAAEQQHVADSSENGNRHALSGGKRDGGGGDATAAKPLLARRLERIQEALLLRTPPVALISEHSRASTVACLQRARRRYLVTGGVSKAYGTAPFDPAENPLLDDGVSHTGKECGDGWPRV